MQRLWRFVRDKKGGHDIDHVRRVYQWAELLAREEQGVDYAVLRPAVILHDICREAEDEDPSGQTDHALAGAARAREILLAEGFAPERVERICACIATHRYSSDKRPPESIEAKILFDADKLDGLGAVGVGRLFMLAGQYGERLCVPPPEGFGDGARTGYRIADLGEYSANLEFTGKMRHVPDRLFLRRAKQEARRLLEPMRAFFALLETELQFLEEAAPLQNVIAESADMQTESPPPKPTLPPVGEGQMSLPGAAAKSPPQSPATVQRSFAQEETADESVSASKERPGVVLYTDGACKRNPGPGGWAYILRCGDSEKEKNGGKKQTTNNEMELMAVVMGLEALKRPCTVELYSDSKYIIDALQKGWVKRWQANGWRLLSKQPAKNQALWERLLELTEIHRLNPNWVKGHADNPYNNRCDELAVEMSLYYDNQP